jgi:hypothetical protein
MSTFDDEPQAEFFEETDQTLESPQRQRRRMRPPRSGGPKRPSPPPPGAVALARLAGFVALAIAVIVGLVFWVGSCQGKSKHDEYASYMNDVRPIAQSSAQAGTAFVNTLGSEKLTTRGLETKLVQWSRQQQEDYNRALALRPPGPLQGLHQQVLTTLQLRAIALAGLATALSQAGTKSTAQVADSLSGQAQTLTASDIVWTNLFKLPAIETLTRLGIRGVTAPPSQFVSNPDVISPRSFGLVYGRLKATTPSGQVSGLHGSALQKTEAVSNGATKVLGTSAPTTVDVGPKLTFQVTFLNSGNFVEYKIPVTLTVVVSGKSVVKQTKKVSSILPQHTQTVSFGNLPLPPSSFGANASVRVQIAKVPGETKLDNNSATYPVFFSLPSGG